ncbi:MAG: DsbE family thiol:disulfide interchange protein [Rhodospirillales bacterium]|nr:DsbE family thiol:disulfide interchange protein [Rhodospirillales bacterium]
MVAHIEPASEATSGIAWRRQLLYAAPAAGVVGLAAVLGLGLTRDPRLLPSTLIGRPVPDFSLPPVQGRTLGLSSADLRSEVSLVNFFASWCVACRAEHPLFMAMAKSGAVTVHGINYKDAPADAARWLDTLGDPYARTGVDRDGRVGIEWGLYGVPETYVVSADGRVMHKHAGPLTEQIRDTTIMPLIERLRKGADRGSR